MGFELSATFYLQRWDERSTRKLQASARNLTTEDTEEN
jgi:hypothetical protein